ncbi:MAG TPA: alpha-galactosidase [Bryobacteraceae bacterium]
MFRIVLATLALSAALSAQITFNAERKLWFLSTATSTCVLGVNERNELQTVYWGAPITREADFPAAHSTPERSSFDPSETRTREEYPGWGGRRFFEPALKISRADGDRDLVLKYASYTIANDSLTIHLKDIHDDIGVSLFYKLHDGVLEKSSKIDNNTHQEFTIESAQSGVWSMPPGDGYKLTYVSGRWAAESQLHQEPIHPGMKILESRRGTTSHNMNPWFMIDQGETTEEHGNVWFGALGSSGNWRLTVEETPYQEVRVTGGYNPFDFGIVLKPGESLSTPPFYGGFSDRGYGGASRTLHRFEREAIFPGGVQSRLRPVLYNSWEATTFHVDEPGQKALAAKAAALGVELFVIDDGWFGARNDDHAGLGDWVVNKKKFPNDLQPLIAEVNRLGMDFGLWVEPEMVNPNSDLYRAHPDWVMNFTGRPRSELRNQLILNLAKPEVKEYIFGFLDRLASTYNIRYFKWDMNRSFSEPGWPGAANQKAIWIDYVLAYYDILDRLRAKHPKLEIEGCSGGGGRIDLGVLKRVDEVWTSDNTEAFDRLRIQEGFSYAYAPKVMSAWVTDVPNMNGRSVPLQFRFLVAMQGALGIGANLNRWSEADTALAKKMIALDKEIRQTVQTGALYRLLSPRTSDVIANQYVSGDGRQSVLFAFRHAQQFDLPAEAIHLEGLAPQAVYGLQYLNGRTAELSGAYLMRHGVDVNLRGDYDSTSVVITRR